MGGTTGCALPNDNVAVSGTKVSDGPIWPVSTTGPNPNGKTDLDYIDVAAEKVDVNGDIEDILYVGYMKCGGTGTWQAVLYLDDGDNLAPTQGDTNGDYLFNFDFAPSSGAVTVKMYQMVNGVWTAQTPPAGTFDGSAAGDYGEVAINLTTLGILPDDTCRTINVSGQGAAVTGGSLTSALKDLVVVEPLSISNCGAINIRKAATGAGLTTTDLFHYVLDQAPAADAGDDDIVHDSTLGKNLNGSGASTEPDTNYKEIDATITVGGTHNWTNVISQTDYKLVEDTIPSPWSLKTITCTYTDIFVSPPASKTVTLYTNGASTGTRFAIPPSTFANGTLAPASCTITNEVTSLTLNKVLPNDNGGTKTSADFVLSAKKTPGNTVVINKADPAANDASVGASALITPGTYVIAETPASTAGYTTSAWTCVDTAANNAPVTVTTANSVSSVAITQGQNVVCSITNDDQPAAVTLHKVVTNDNGGTATGSEFTLTLTPKAGGTAVINGADPAPTTTTTTLGAGISANISAGTYVLGETTTLTGYTGSSWTCTGGTLAGNELTVTNGATVTCYVVNDDQPATVTLHKVLPNDNGGTMTGDQFTLTLTPKAGGTAVINGVDPAPTTTTTTLGAGISNSNVSAGVYVVAESPASTTGYTSAWTCTGGTLTGNELTVTNGATVTCYVVNDDNASTVTLHKVVINDDGGTATGEEFFLTLTPSAGGAALIDDQDPAPSTSASDLGDGASSSLVNAGTYTLGEHGGPAGYTDLGWHCVVTGTTDVVAVDANDGITVGNGADITCYVTNDDQPATLTLTKIVNNDDGGNAGPGDFTLKATNNGQEYELSGAGGAATSTAPAGTYELSETGPAGYTPMNWACSINGSEMTTLEGTTINVPNGGVVSCEIVNDDLPVDLTLDKSDGGANAAPGTAFDYTLTITNIGERNVDLDEPVWVYDTLPAGMEFVTVPSTCEVAGSDVACEIDPALLPAGGEPVVITLTVRFLPGTPAGTYTNLAFVETDDDPAPDEPVCPSEIPVGGKAIPTNNVDCEDTPLTPVYGLTIVKAGLEASGTGWAPTDGVVDFGATVGYTLTVSATGNAPQTNVVVTDTLPVGMTYVADSGQCLDGVVCTVTYDAATHTVTATIATMAQGTSAVVSFRATVDAAPAVAAGTTYTWQGDNVGAVVSTEVPKVPSNTVTVKATHAELPKTGSAHLEVGGYGLLSMLLGVGFVIATKRRRDDETAYVTAE